jgi:hypothetical protein
VLEARPPSETAAKAAQSRDYHRLCDAYQKEFRVEFDASTFPGGVVPAGFTNTQVPIDMGAAFLMLGSVTIPNGFSVASPAGYWAWIRYFSALAAQADLRVTIPFADLDPHQKSVLSDDFGVAVTMQWLFGFVGGFNKVVDGRRFVLQYAHLLTQQAPPAAKIGSSKCPDFVVLDNTGRWQVIECKGTQTSLAQLRFQLNRACEQKGAIEIDPALVGFRLAAGLYLVSESEVRESRMMVRDPAAVSRLIRLEDGQRAVEAANRLSAARSLGLAGYTQVAEELALVDVKEQNLQELLTEEERRRSAIPKSERIAAAIRDLQVDRQSFSLDDREFSGREFSTDISLPEIAYESRRLTARFGIEREYLEAIRSSPPNALLETIDSALAKAGSNESIVVQSDNVKVSIKQSGIFASEISFE